MPALSILLYEGAATPPLEPALRASVMTSLLEAGLPVAVVKDLGATVGGGGGARLVLGRFGSSPLPKAAATSDSNAIRFHDVEGRAAAEVLALVDEARREIASPIAPRWKPWFPVIDYARCTNCMQCLSFCLFDVYGVSADKKIEVTNPTKCKADCPACSRVCPEVAIVFPKYKASPINGDEVRAEDTAREKMQVDISTLLGGDIYSVLRERTARANSRFSKERDEDRALEERRRCLVKLGGAAVAPEVLAALPSEDAIRERAEKAMAMRTESVGDHDSEGEGGDR